MRSLICILGAVKEEIAGIKKQMTVGERMKLGKADAWLGQWEGADILLVRTGVGKTRAKDAIDRVLERFSPTVLVSLGYAGGCDARLKTGDLLLADSLWEIDLNADQEKSSQAVRVDFTPVVVERLPEPFPASGAKVFRGGLVTVDAVVTDAKKKRRIGETHAVLACDMETSVLAKAAAGRGVRFVSLRSISDTVEEQLMDVSPFLEKDGEVSKLKAGWYVITHPSSLKSFKNLKDIATLATQNLTLFLRELLKTL